MNIPKYCTDCEYENSCSTARNMEDCLFYGMAKPSLLDKLRILFGKLFR